MGTLEFEKTKQSAGNSSRKKENGERAEHENDAAEQVAVGGAGCGEVYHRTSKYKGKRRKDEVGVDWHFALCGEGAVGNGYDGGRIQ